jgi:hypothetical protein
MTSDKVHMEASSSGKVAYMNKHAITGFDNVESIRVIWGIIPGLNLNYMIKQSNECS